MIRRIQMYCRNRGDLGVFREERFDVEAPEEASNNELFDAWQVQHGDKFEPNHMINCSKKRKPCGNCGYRCLDADKTCPNCQNDF